MGRLFRASRVAQVVRKSLESRITKRETEYAPPWLEVVESIPPSEVLVRTVPQAHQAPNKNMRKPRRTFRPQRITYEEDELRTTFFRDHPWELARPRVVVESDGKDYQRYDWSKGLRQDGMPLCGESVVQRQLWMMHNGGMTKDQAYDAARREFYTLRHQEDVERRIAQEEARMVGAYFGKSPLQVGMGLENSAYEWWKKYAERQTAKLEAARNKVNSSFSAGEPDEEAGVSASTGSA